VETVVMGGGILVASVSLWRPLETGDAIFRSGQALTDPVEAVRAGRFARRAPLGSAGIPLSWSPARLADRARSANGGVR
jgi:hypothetical protein